MTTCHEAEITLYVNNREENVSIEHRDLLLDVLRQKLGLKGTKRSCDAEVCGACTVLVEGKPVSSCSTLAIECAGKHIRTIESAENDPVATAIQLAFIKHGALQCGFCTPGMIMAIRSLLERESEPSLGEIKHYLHGNICRCTGYQKIIEAVADAAQSLKQYS